MGIFRTGLELGKRGELALRTSLRRSSVFLFLLTEADLARSALLLCNPLYLPRYTTGFA